MRFGKSYAAFYCFQQRKMHSLLCAMTLPVHAMCYNVFTTTDKEGVQ